MARNNAHHLRDEQEPRMGVWRKRGKLAENWTTPNDGHWIEVGGYYPLTVTIEGDDFEGMVEICVSNSEKRPADTDNGSLLGPPVLAGREVQYINAPFMWVKLRLTNLANGSITEANLYGAPSA